MNKTLIGQCTSFDLVNLIDLPANDVFFYKLQDFE